MFRKLSLAGLFFAALSVSVVTAAPDAGAALTPASSKHHGTQLSDQWWNWAVGVPSSASPLTGAPCAVGQVGSTWNLAGAPISGVAVTRTCTVPVGKSIFLPVVNAECSLAEDNGPTDQDLTTCATGYVTGFVGSASLNGRQLPIVQLTSQPFDLRYAANNAFGIGGDASGTTRSVASGYWVSLHPLPPGTYLLHVSGLITSGPAVGYSQDVTYVVKVVDRHARTR